MNTLLIKELSILYLPAALGWGLWVVFKPRVKVAGPLSLSLLWNFVALAFALIPGLLIFRWTIEKRMLAARIAIQGIIFACFILFLLPALLFEMSDGVSDPVAEPSRLWTFIQIQLMILFSGIGILSVIEFAKRGKGTPVPFDPPEQLVMSGPYAYFVNPMQFSTAGFLLSYGWFLESWMLAASSLMVIIYAIGIANPSEGEDLNHRFKKSWKPYNKQFIAFIPRFRPIDSGKPAIIYFSESCGTCNEIGRWFKHKHPIGLQFVPAEKYPGGIPKRVTYVSEREKLEGVRAIGRALVHINLLWATLGCLIQVPGISPLLQIIVDLDGVQPPTKLAAAKK